MTAMDTTDETSGPRWAGMAQAADPGTAENAPARSLHPAEIHRAAVESGAVPFSLPPTVFLLLPIVFAWIQAPGIGAAVATGILLVYGVLFVHASGIALYPQPVRLVWFALMTALVLALIPVIGENVLFMVMFQAMTHVILLPWRWAVPTMVVMCVAVAGIAAWLGAYFAVVLAVMGLAMSWGIGHGIQQQVLQEKLDAAERRNAALAVAAERERIGRDLHDILGHSLTSATVSAQLAQRLLDTDPAAAHEQLAHIESTLRQSLADVRATASGMQTVRAATEIASARSVLAAVGIGAQVPSALPTLDDDRAELFGYVVREAVTNIVRHARAEHARITISEDEVSISDDGVGIPEGTARTGLRGLEQRIADAGGALAVESSPAGTTVTATMGPAHASPRPGSPKETL